MRSDGKDNERDNHRDDKNGDKEEKDEEERDKNRHHAYKDPDRTIRTIFGDKVTLETRQERKLIARAVMALANSDEKITDPKF
jgi:hypothetical protein